MQYEKPAVVATIETANVLAEAFGAGSAIGSSNKKHDSDFNIEGEN